MSLVSIIVPVYNCELYLDRCISSILCQSIKDIEIILVDDGSTDRSSIICDEYVKKDNRIQVIHKKNNGLGAARNTGLKYVKSKYVGFVDGDDYIVPDMYEYLLKTANKYNADICAGTILLSYGKEKKISKKRIVEECYESHMKLLMYLKIGIKYRNSQYSVCNKIYAIKLFKTIQFPENQIYEDVVTNYKLIENANKLVISNKYMYHYFQKSISITRNTCSSKDMKLISTCNQIRELSADKPNIIRKRADVMYARSFFSILMKAYFFGMDNSFQDKTGTLVYLHNNLNLYYRLLMKSEITLNRKILISLLRWCPKLMNRTFKIYRWVRY